MQAQENQFYIESRGHCHRRCQGCQKHKITILQKKVLISMGQKKKSLFSFLSNCNNVRSGGASQTSRSTVQGTPSYPGGLSQFQLNSFLFLFIDRHRSISYQAFDNFCPALASRTLRGLSTGPSSSSPWVAFASSWKTSTSQDANSFSINSSITRLPDVLITAISRYGVRVNLTAWMSVRVLIEKKYKFWVPVHIMLMLSWIRCYGHT